MTIKTRSDPQRVLTGHSNHRAVEIEIGSPAQIVDMGTSLQEHQRDCPARYLLGRDLNDQSLRTLQLDKVVYAL
jgi:hypothetical protein